MGVLKGVGTVFMFCFLIGCAEKPGKKGILSVNDMKLVMWDMLQADEFVGTFMRLDSTIHLDSAANVYYQKIFFLHKTSQKEFFRSFDYYKMNPGYYKILLDSLNDYGNRERDEFSKRRMRLDSLKMIK